jgi:hypothetical protein
MTDAKYWADNYHRLQKQRARSQPKPRQETGPPSSRFIRCCSGMTTSLTSSRLGA